jgi:lipoprotein signal peptidase
MVLALLATIIVLDQSTKWWAWRHVPTASINSGGDILVGATVSAWYADPVQGSLLDLLGFGLLSIAICVLIRRRQSLAALISECMMLGGWGSNLLDRLVMHQFTAPGSDRGAVDFIPLINSHVYNVADLFIIVGTPLFVLVLGGRYLRKRTDSWQATGVGAANYTQWEKELAASK